MPISRINGTDIYWRLDGDSTKQPLILVNSLGTDQSSWDIVMPYLLQTFHVLRYDKRGHGLSGWQDQELEIETNARDVLALMDLVGWKTADYCGISIGGMTAMALMGLAPERFRHLILSNASPHIKTEWMAGRVAAIRGEGLRAVQTQVVNRFFTETFREQQPGYYETALQNFALVNPQAYCRWGEAIIRMDYRESIRKYEGNALVIAGKYDVACKPEDGQLICDRLQNGRYVELNTAHLGFYEVPIQYASIVATFCGSAGDPDESRNNGR